MKKKYLIKSITLSAIVIQAAFSWSQTTFNYTGAYQTYIVPAGVGSVSIEAWGASGWTGANSGGDGGYTYGELVVTPGQSLYVYVGGQGEVAIGANVPSGGGWNGGGDGMTNTSPNSVGGGGGASDVRTTFNVDPMDGTSLGTRLIVAGGGGGSTDNTNAFGGDGGGLIGQNAGDFLGFPIGEGGTQVAGGASGGGLGQGGDALVGMTPWNGGGGGGYYGGGVSTAHCGGGGGSSYIGGVTAGSMTQGVHTGNGIVIITPLCNALDTTVSATSICLGDAVNLFASSNGTGVISWDNGVTNGVNYTPTAIGTVTYTATSSDMADCSFTVDITVMPNPTISLTPSDEISGNDGSINLTILTGTPPYIFDWDNDGTGDNDDTQNLTGLAGGNYTVIMTDSTGCSVSSAATVDSQLGLDNASITFNVYPNPTSGLVVLSAEGAIAYVVYNLLGEVVISGSGNNTVPVDLTGVAKGTYMLKIKIESTEKTISIIKE